MTLPCFNCGAPVTTSPWQVRRNKGGLVACSRECRRGRLCSVEGCGRPHEARGLCHYHYHLAPDVADKKAEHRKPYLHDYIRSIHGRYVALKRAAKDKGLGFNITEADHTGLLQQPCHYCGGPLSPTGHALDRKDNSVGYVLSNVVTCCYACNKIKGTMLTYEEMLIVSKALLDFRRR